MNVSKGSQRVVLQPDTEAEVAFLANVSSALAGETDGMAWWTLDTAEYPALNHNRDAGDVGEKALVLSWGGIGNADVYPEGGPPKLRAMLELSEFANSLLDSVEVDRA